MNLETLLSADWLPDILRTPAAQAVIGIALLAIVALAIHLVVRPYVLRLVRFIVHQSRIDWDQILYEAKVLHRAAVIVPLMVLNAGIPVVPGLGDDLRGLIQRVVAACMILVVARTVDAFLSALHEIYLRLPSAAMRPIKSYVQLAKVFVYLIAGIFIIARLADQTPWYFLSGLGAMMAVILLVFRDTLLSLVASVQLTNNDLIRVGDWIEMPQFGADGDVIDIALNTVKVQNWDRTVTVIPTHKFLDHSFKNWRNMFEGGGRRIKRALHVDMSTIRFLDAGEIERFSRFALLRDYMAAKKQELEEYNAQYSGDPEVIVNARRLTNVGTLRAYIIAYLRNHPQIHSELTFLVRQLAPSPEGLPIEIYVFTKDTRWVHHEAIQADIFDHVLAIVPEFGLRVYQHPSGADLAGLARRRPVGAVKVAGVYGD